MLPVWTSALSSATSPLALGWTLNRTPVHLDPLSHQILAIESFLVCFILTRAYPSGYPVRLSKLRWMFYISPYPTDLSWMSSLVASSWVSVTKRIWPSTVCCGWVHLHPAPCYHNPHISSALETPHAKAMALLFLPFFFQFVDALITTPILGEILSPDLMKIQWCAILPFLS